MLSIEHALAYSRLDEKEILSRLKHEGYIIFRDKVKKYENYPIYHTGIVLLDENKVYLIDYGKSKDSKSKHNLEITIVNNIKNILGLYYRRKHLLHTQSDKKMVVEKLLHPETKEKFSTNKYNFTRITVKL